MLGHFSNYKNVWVEITKSDHGHGGEGWEFGTCLWSPVRDRGGADRYSVMREPGIGDLVLHFYHDQWPDGISDNRICGYSKVQAQAEEIDGEPPLAGDWSGLPPYYRIRLTGYTPFDNPLPYESFLQWYGDDIRRELLDGRPKFYPFNTYGSGIRTAQGIYLARCTQRLFTVIRDALLLEEAEVEPKPQEAAPFTYTSVSNTKRRGARKFTISESDANPHLEYAEGTRTARERFFFARNPKLVRDAKAVYGYHCQVCNFNFKENYGDLGHEYIECHHRNPLSERTEEEWSEGIRSTLDDVNVVCANCHRMIHRRRPALTVEELRNLIHVKG